MKFWEVVKGLMEDPETVFENETGGTWFIDTDGDLCNRRPGGSKSWSVFAPTLNKEWYKKSTYEWVEVNALEAEAALKGGEEQVEVAVTSSGWRVARISSGGNVYAVDHGAILHIPGRRWRVKRRTDKGD